jgi:hypothetical protein
MPDLEIVGTSASAAAKQYRASIFPVEAVPVEFAELILALERELDFKNLVSGPAG